jgi:NAD(P)H dehydrogenase (quinone)
MRLRSVNWSISKRFTVVCIWYNYHDDELLIAYMSPGSPWGAGTFAAADGSRQPTALELEIAEIQGKSFYAQVTKSK